jgi:predicted oxidoreductase
MQVIVGSMNPDRLTDMCKGADIELSRQEWYEIYRAAGNQLP